MRPLKLATKSEGLRARRNDWLAIEPIIASVFLTRWGSSSTRGRRSPPPQPGQDVLLLGLELGRYDAGDRLADHLARFVAEDARGRGVPRHDPTVEALADNRVARR